MPQPQTGRQGDEQQRQRIHPECEFDPRQHLVPEDSRRWESSEQFGVELTGVTSSVVPCRKESSSAGATDAALSTASMPVTAPSSGLSGVVSTFEVNMVPSLSSTESVKVPPMSTESRIIASIVRGGMDCLPAPRPP